MLHFRCYRCCVTEFSQHHVLLLVAVLPRQTLFESESQFVEKQMLWMGMMNVRLRIMQLHWKKLPFLVFFLFTLIATRVVLKLHHKNFTPFLIGKTKFRSPSQK